MSANSVGPSQGAREAELTERVLRSFDSCQDPRLRKLLQALTRHLHELVREVRLSEEEWAAAITFLTEVGHLTDDERQEFVLLSDVLGLSSQTVTVNDEAYGGATEATVLGPFFVEGSPEVPNGGDIANGAPGEPCWVEGTVADHEGRPLAGARVEVWEADEAGQYDVQYTDGRTASRGHLFTEDDGSYRFWAITPTPYPIPDDGPVGRMLRAVGRSPMRASHLHFKVSHPAGRTLVTHLFPEGDERLDSDTVFGVRESLVRPFERQGPGTRGPDGLAVATSWTRTRFDIVLAPPMSGGAPR